MSDGRAPLDAAERHALAVRLLRVVLERELVRAGRVVLERERELAPTAVGAPWRAPEARKGDLATWWRVGPTPPFQTRALRDVVVARLHDRDRRGVWPRHPAARRVEAALGVSWDTLGRALAGRNLNPRTRATLRARLSPALGDAC